MVRQALIHAARYYREHRLRPQQFAWIVAMLNHGVNPWKVNAITSGWVIDSNP